MEKMARKTNHIELWVLVIAALIAVITGSAVDARVQFSSRSSSEQQVEANNQSSSSNSCHWREFDLCSIGVASLFQNPNGLPQSEAELKRQCEFLEESARCFESFAHKCMTELQLHLFDMFATSGMQILRDFCRPNSELRSNYTKHVQCFREIQRKYQRSCVTDLQVGFESIHKLNLTTRMETGCCNINRLNVCILEPVENDCGLEAEDTIRKLMSTLAGRLLELPCQQYDPFSEKCTTLLPKSGTKPHSGRNTSALSKIISGFANVPMQSG